MSLPAVPEPERPGLVRLSDIANQIGAEGMELRRKYARDGAFLRLRIVSPDEAYAFKRCANELGFEATLNKDGTGYQMVVVIPNAVPCSDWQEEARVKVRVVIVKTTEYVALIDGDPSEMDEGALYAMCDDEVNWSVEAHIADPSELKAYADEFGYLQDLEPKAEP